MKAGKTTLGFAGAAVLGMTNSSARDVGFATAPPRGGDNSFLGSSKLNYGVYGGGDDMMGTDEHSQKVQRLLEKVRRMTNSNNTT
jgi:hypothetical protein